MQTKHTLGPWTVSGLDIYAPAPANVRPHVARVIYGGRADARLIAAAPELLEALQRISDSINGLSGPIPTRNTPEFWTYVKAIADEAIAKATAH